MEENGLMTDVLALKEKGLEVSLSLIHIQMCIRDSTTYEKDYQTPDLDEEKKDYVKDRLKRSAELNINTEEKELSLIHIQMCIRDRSCSSVGYTR